MLRTLPRLPIAVRAARIVALVGACALFTEGNRLFAASQRAGGARREELAEQALAAYVQSLALVRSRNAVYNAAMVLVALGRPAEAYAYLTEYLADPEISDAERDDATARRDGLRPEIALVRLESVPSRAAVTLLATTPIPLGETPLEVPFAPGAHSIRLTYPGYEETTRPIQLVAGQVLGLHFTPRPLPRTLVVDVPSDAAAATLLLDGEPIVPGALELRPGTHELALIHEDGRAVHATVELSPGDAPREVTLELPPPEPSLDTPDATDTTDTIEPSELRGATEPTPPPDLTLRPGRRRRRVGAALMTLGGAFGLGAFALRLRSRTLNDRHRDLRADDPDAALVDRARDIERNIDRVNAWGRALTVLSALGGGIGLTLALRGRRARREAEGSADRVSVRVGPGFAAMSWRFRGASGDPGGTP